MQRSKRPQEDVAPKLEEVFQDVRGGPPFQGAFAVGETVINTAPQFTCCIYWWVS